MKTMADVLSEHGFRKWGDRLDDANWVVCLCGKQIEGREKWQALLATHQADSLAAAGFGPVSAGENLSQFWDKVNKSQSGGHLTAEERAMGLDGK